MPVYVETDCIAAVQQAAVSGETRPPGIDEKVNLHFACLVQKEGTSAFSCASDFSFLVRTGGLYELDGRKKFPIHHGPSTEVTLLEDSVRIAEEFMARFTSVPISQTARWWGLQDAEHPV